MFEKKSDPRESRRPQPRSRCAFTVFAALSILAFATTAAEEPFTDDRLPRFPPPRIELPSVSADALVSLPDTDIPAAPGASPRIGTASGSGFYRAHLLPRLNSILDDLRAVHPDLPPGHEPVADVAFQDLTYRAQHGFERATRKAFKDYLLESTGLELRARRYGENLSRRRGAASAGEGSRSVRVRLGASHALPRVDIRCRVGEYAGLRFSLRAAGSVGVEFDRARAGWTRVYAGYDARRDRYDLSLRIDF